MNFLVFGAASAAEISPETERIFFEFVPSGAILANNLRTFAA